ncbi:Disks large -like protein 5, partial [Trichinella spiralis]
LLNREKIEMDERRVTNVESTPSNSHDSAIDADMAEWEVETLELNMNGAQKNEDLGLELRGGRDDPVFGQLVPIYVTSVAVGSRLDGVLRTYDCIMMVNNIDVSLMERRSVMDILRNSSAVKMVIKRRRLVGMKLISVPLAAASDGDVGIVFEDGVYVSKIKTSSAAAKAGHLAVGDRLVYINDVPVENRSASTVEELVRSFNGCGLVLAVVKSPPVMSPITPSSSTFPFQTSLHSSSAQMKHQDSCANCQSTAAAAAAVVVTKQKRDFAVQVSFVVTETHAPVKKYESLFDKMHDKIFGRSERKATVRAAAAVPIDTTDTPNESSKRWHNGQNSDRRARPSSVYSCYTVVDRSNSKGGVTAEQQVLQQLDSILEASERECDSKNNNNNNNKALLLGVMNSERSGGGTWPKYKPNVNGSGVEMANVANGTVEPSPPLASAPAPAPDKFAGRRSALQAFHGKIVDKQSAVESRLRNTFAKRSSKIRSTEARPVSYHPTSVISGQYSLIGSKFSARPMSPLVGGNIHSTSSSSPSDDSPPQCLSLDSTAASSPLHHAAAGHKNLAYYGNHLNQGNHGRPGSLMMFKPNLQLHVAHAMPVVTNTTNSNNNNRYSPCLAFDHQSPMASHIHDQDVDQRSYASQSSGSRGAAAVAGLFGSAAGDHQQCSSKSLHRLDAGRYHPAIHSLSRTKRGIEFMCNVEFNAYYYYCYYFIVSNKLERVIPLHSFSSDEYNNQCGGGRLIKGDVRTLHIEKRSSHEGLGISVASSGNGVFVSSVSENSLAARHGLQVGDQLLEVCGINMRSANIQHASNVLSHLGRSEQITLMVQYNPNRYTREMTDYHSVCSTPRATPSSMLSTQGSKAFMSQDSSLQSTSATQSHELLTGSHCSIHYEPRFVFLKRDSDDWGFTLIGGNAIGIFVDDVKPAVACVVGPDTLRTGDQILEFDGVNFRKLTLEQALMEIGQRSVGSEVSVLVQYNDSSAILEEEFLFKRSGSEISTVEGTSTEGGGGSRRGTIRRSLKFIRRSSRSSHQRTPSKESRDLESDSTIIDELYQRVERLDYKQKRPLLLLGTLVDVIVAKLLEDYPKMFVQCVPECVKPMPVPALEQGLLQNLYVDYRKRDKLFEITRVAVVKDLIDKGYHCILHVNPLAIERLHRLQIYPVVIFVKFKNFKQIKELCDDRLSSKQAKEMFENAAKVEAECHHLFSGYQKCKRGAGDSFYVRVTVDRQAENTDELSFRSGDILRVDNTVFNGVAGLWRAWLVDQEGRERSCGIIPSKNRLEEEFLFKRSGSEISTVEGTSTEGGGGSRRGTIRRSLKFIRRSSRSSHQRTPSKESRDLESDSTIIDELYQRVERLDYKQKRPLLLLGTLVDVIVAKLLEDYPKMFVQCVPECVKPMPVPALEQGLLQNLYVDYRKRDKLFEITRVAVVKDLIDKGYHCILHVNPLAIERLHRLQIYPVVIFVKFKNFKQIKELCDDRLSSKQAKEMFENAAKVEAECHHLFSATIHGPHHSIKHICQQIACTVEHEQKKTLWIISGDTM